jgi:hypothetical protein
LKEQILPPKSIFYLSLSTSPDSHTKWPKVTRTTVTFGCGVSNSALKERKEKEKKRKEKIGPYVVWKATSINGTVDLENDCLCKFDIDQAKAVPKNQLETGLELFVSLVLLSFPISSWAWLTIVLLIEMRGTTSRE